MYEKKEYIGQKYVTVSEWIDILRNYLTSNYDKYKKNFGKYNGLK